MRNAFVAELSALAEAGSPLVLLSGDIGNRLFDGFKASFPDQFYNCGIAEANMMSVAAGMAFCGLRPITYTITPFTTTRCLEQIRVDVCYHNLPVIIAGVGAGLSYAANGVTHQSCEDIALLRCLPNMAVVCPGDPIEVRLALRAAASHPGPVYIRMGKKGEPAVHETEPDFIIGKALTIREGTEVCLLATGNLLPMAVETGKALEAAGLSARVVSYHTVKPLDEELLAEAFEAYPLVVTIEEHSLLGGLGSAVAEWLVDGPATSARLLRIGTGDFFLHEAGGQNYVREHHGLTVEAIAARVREALGK
jgi:transketolase